MAHDKPAAEQHQIAAAIQSLERPLKAARENPTEYERETHTWAIRTGKGIIIYTTLTVVIAVAAIWSAIDAQKAVNLTQENFAIDQRPYIWINNNLELPGYFEFLKKIVWSFHFTNYGKTPANNVLLKVKMSVGGTQYPILEAHPRPPRGNPLPPNKDDFNTAVSDAQFTRDEFQRVFGVDFGIGISGLILYQGASDAWYESRFCLAHLATGAILHDNLNDYCRNEMK
jgi:hypothetical protein